MLITKLKLKCDLCLHKIDVPDDKLPDGWGRITAFQVNKRMIGSLIAGLPVLPAICPHCLSDIKRTLLKCKETKRD